MNRIGRVFIAGLLLAFLARAGLSEPVYKQARAKLVRPRGGMPNVLAKLAAGKEVAVKGPAYVFSRRGRHCPFVIV